VRLCGSWRSDNISADLSGHLLQGCELLLINKLKLCDEVVEMLVAGVDVGLGADAHDPVKVMNIDVNKHAIQASQDLFALRLKSLREGNIGGDRKQIFIVYLGLDPVHQEGYVLGRGEVGGLLILSAILPQILELGSPRHCRTALPRTLLTNCSVYEVDSVEEVHNMNSQPIIEILSFR